MKSARHWLRVLKILIVLSVVMIGAYQSQHLRQVADPTQVAVQLPPINDSPAAVALSKIPIKGRAPKTGYVRAAFSDGWGELMNCDVRNYILNRDMTHVSLVPHTCKVASGTLLDPYTATTILFLRGPNTSDDIQIDHVVALSDAWQKGAQQLTSVERYALANDPLNLLAVQGDANQAKADSDAASWLPPNKAYRCPYVARQIAVKSKYGLWVTRAEYDAIVRVLSDCPTQALPSIL